MKKMIKNTILCVIFTLLASMPSINAAAAFRAALSTSKMSSMATKGLNIVKNSKTLQYIRNTIQLPKKQLTNAFSAAHVIQKNSFMHSCFAQIKDKIASVKGRISTFFGSKFNTFNSALMAGGTASFFVNDDSITSLDASVGLGWGDNNAITPYVFEQKIKKFLVVDGNYSYQKKLEDLQELVIKEPSQVIKYVNTNFDTLIQSREGKEIINMINEDIFNSKGSLNSIIIDKADTLMQSGLENDLYALCFFIRNNSELISSIAPKVIQNFEYLVKSPEADCLINCFITNNKDKAFAQKIAQLSMQQGNFNSKIFNKTMKYVSCDPDIEKEFANLASDDIDSLMKVGIYKHNCPNYSINNIDAYANTPSKKHILKYATNITKEYPEGSKNSNIRGMLNKALANEEHIINEGKIPFYHGRKRQYDFVSQLFTFLYNVNNASTKNTTYADDFIFTHLKEPVYNKEDLKEEKKIRENLIDHGIVGNGAKDPKYKYLLFVNHFLLGNSTKRTSSSFKYMLYNNNAGDISVTSSDIFDMHNFKPFYEKYENEIMELEKSYNSIGQHGQILQIGIDPKKTQRNAYLSSTGAPKKSLIVPRFKYFTKEIYDVNEIIENLDINPDDQKEFCIVNTWDKNGGLNPEDMTVNVLDPARHDPKTSEKLKKLDIQRDKLFARIKEDILKSKIS